MQRTTGLVYLSDIFFFRFKEKDGSAVSNKFDYRALVSSVGPLRRSLEGIREIVL